MTEEFESRLREVISAVSPVIRDSIEADVELLLSTGVKSRDSLLIVLKDKQGGDDIRLAACRILGHLRDEKAISDLLVALDEQNPQLTWEAAKSLILISSSEATQEVINILFAGKDPHNRVAAAYVLGLSGDSRAVEPLIQVVGGTDLPEVRSHAAEALGNLADDKATDFLINALEDNSAEVRFWSAFALGEIGNPKAIPELEKLSAEDKTNLPKLGLVSQEARRAMERIGRM